MPDKRVRGSQDLNITLEGKDEIRRVNAEFLKRGCPWRVYSSSQTRAIQSAYIAVQNCESVTIMKPCPELESWHLGGLENRPVSEVLPLIQEMVAKKPWVVPAGMAPNSTSPGESFNAFKTRVLDKVRNIMDVFDEHPTKRILTVTHFHVNRLIESWLAKYRGNPGIEDDMYEPTIYNEDKGRPGDLYLLRREPDRRWSFKPLNPVKYSVLPPGIYSLRHGSTNLN